jgi:hypothetical protein
MLRVKVHKAEGSVVVAACDSELVGTKARQGKLRLDVCEGFYGGDEIEEAALKNFLSICSSANLVGKRCVAEAVRAGFVEAESVIEIGGLPHVQLYRV